MVIEGEEEEDKDEGEHRSEEEDNEPIGTGLAALSLPQGLSLPVVAYIIKFFLPFPFA